LAGNLSRLSGEQWQLVLILRDERAAVFLRSERLAYF